MEVINPTGNNHYWHWHNAKLPKLILVIFKLISSSQESIQLTFAAPKRAFLLAVPRRKPGAH
jgi:hypothetical protein